MKIKTLISLLFVHLHILPQDAVSDKEKDNMVEQVPQIAGGEPAAVSVDGANGQEANTAGNMPKTLDTMGADDSGNWVLKRVWWEKAEKSFGEVMALNAQILDQQMEYFAIRNDVDKQLDAAKRDLSLTIVDITKVTSYLLSLLADSDKIISVDAESIGGFKGTVLDNKPKLEALQNAIDALAKFDGDMDSVIVKVIDQTHKCNDYEAKAWEDFKQIGRVLNDEKAKNLYHQVENYRKNIEMVSTYLEGDLKKSFSAVMSSSKAKLQETKTLVKELHDSGIDLAYILKGLNEGVDYHEEADDSTEEPAPKPVKKSTNIWTFMREGLMAIWDAILWLPRKIMALFGIKF